MRDLLVVGGGPAGLATALYAARAGLDVEVWDKRAGTIDKACGEGLMPGAVTALESLSVKPEGHDLVGIRYLAGSRSAEAPFRAGVGRGVRRTTLHAALRDAALDLGVPLSQRAAVSVTPVRRLGARRRRLGSATSSPPTACTPPSAGCSASTAAPRRTVATACAATTASRPGRRTSRCTGLRTPRRT